MFKTELIPCACGCGELRTAFDSRGRPRKYIRGHGSEGKGNQAWLGRKHTIESRLKISQAKIGKKLSPFTKEHRKNMVKSKLGVSNPQWRGENVGYTGVHHWVQRHLPKPELCQICNKVPPYDLANISNRYLRDINDYQWLCRKCHMLSDGRLARLSPQKGIV